MNNRTATSPSDTSLRSMARIAGVLYLAIIVCGLFAFLLVRGTLIVPGDAAITADNIRTSEGLFRLGIASDFIMILCDVALGLLLYAIFRTLSPTLALLAAFFRLAQATALGINLLNLFLGLQLVSGAGYLAVVGAEQRQALMMLYLDAHTTGYAISMVFFGLSLVVLGYLVFKSDAFPGLLGMMLMIAAVGYLTDSFVGFLWPATYAEYSDLFGMIVFAPALIAELAFCLWLMVKGVRSQPQQQNIPSTTRPAQTPAA